MHESGIIEELLGKVNEIAEEAGASKVTKVKVSIGALAGIGPDHLLEHFHAATPGTLMEDAEFEIGLSEDPMAEHAGSLLLESVEMEQ
jgi:Zn finger protein HypA/HybF involved in hydrogenase expression